MLNSDFGPLPLCDYLYNTMPTIQKDVILSDLLPVCLQNAVSGK